MKRNKLVLLLGVLLSLFAFAACSNAAGGGSSGGGSGGGSKGPFKVTFNDNDTIVRTVEIAYGQTISASQQPSNPSKLFNYFLYWSESKASQKTAVEFDFTKPIKKDTVLYAIYTPKLVSTNAITDLTPTQIQIQLYDINVFPLDDGSYAGLKFQHSTDGSNFVDFPLSIPSSCYDVPYGSYGDRYLTYTFPSPLPGGTNYI